MQSIHQPSFPTFASDKLLQNLEFFCATALDSTRIVKNIALMIGEYEFVIDRVLASLVLLLDNRREVLFSLTSMDGSSLTWSGVRPDPQ